MPTYTPRLQLPRPHLDDPADGPDGFNDLTDVLDPLVAVYGSGTTAARPAAPAAGSFYWNTETKALEFYNGTAWGSASGSASVGVAVPILDVGVLGQNRAGRQLTVADFTSLGLAQPIGLWNLSGLTNLGSDGRALANKGAVPFGVGINGAAATSAVFAGSASQALYIADTGAADPFRIRTGSWGCWFRTAKRGVNASLLSKLSAAAGNYGWEMNIGPTNVLGGIVSLSGSDVLATAAVSDVADDRWHFAVMTFDGTALRWFVDGALEAVLAIAGAIFSSAAPINIGGRSADAATAAGQPHYGRVDEAFVTADVLSEDQIRCLYCAKLAHALGAVPGDVRIAVHRLKKGAPLTVTDFPTSPLRLYNFTAADLAGAGSDTAPNRLLTNNGAAVSVAGVDGTPAGAFSFAGAQSLSATDAGLPAGTTARSYGCWFKTTGTGVYAVFGWGNANGQVGFYLSSGAIQCVSTADAIVGPYVADGQWHFLATVEDNAAGDGVRRKLYLDGRLVGGSTVLNAITLGGANRFRLGAWPDGTTLFVGQIDAAFVTGYALTAADIALLYAKGTQDLAASSKNAGDHVERVDGNSLLATFDTLQSQYTVDLGVAA